MIRESPCRISRPLNGEKDDRTAHQKQVLSHRIPELLK